MLMVVEAMCVWDRECIRNLYLLLGFAVDI